MPIDKMNAASVNNELISEYWYTAISKAITREILLIFIALAGPNAIGIVLIPDFLSTSMSRISNGMAMAKINANLSMLMSIMREVLIVFSLLNDTRNAVEVAQINAKNTVFTPGILLCQHPFHRFFKYETE